MAQSTRMAGLRGLFDHSQLLVPDSSPGGVLAVAQAIAIPSSVARLDWNVGCGRGDDAALAISQTLQQLLVMVSGSRIVCSGVLALFAIEEEFHPETAGWNPRDRCWPSRTVAGDYRNSQSSAASSVSGASVRNAGVECRHGSRGLLRVICVRTAHRRRHDSNGGCGTREEIWRCL